MVNKRFSIFCGGAFSLPASPPPRSEVPCIARLYGVKVLQTEKRAFSNE